MRVNFDAERDLQAPKCIFIPDRTLIRMIMKSLVIHEQGFNDDDDFLLKYGLVNKL
jgi:hypothetical protein